MHREFLMGNEAIALGALSAGVQLVSGYPGTPSTEVLETAARRRRKDVYVEWSVNEKAALEVAAGAAYAGARVLVTMKQVGLNVASDPLMSLAYIGVKGGMAILVADDPGPISSQTEQDTRTFAKYAKLPVFDPSSVEEAYAMMSDAFDLSEKYHTPVLIRPTTRIDHAYADVLVKDPDEYFIHNAEGFVKDSSRWVIFPRLSVVNHAKMEKRNQELTSILSAYQRNRIYPETGIFTEKRIGIVSQGISFSHAMDALDPENRPRLMKVATPFPFPDKLALEFLTGLDEVLALEELDPVIESSLWDLIGREGLHVTVHGKRDSFVKPSGENTPEEIHEILAAFTGFSGNTPEAAISLSDLPSLPVRPPVLCAGCPHRASFYAVKKAMKGKKTIFCGDIGCYTLGNAKPLDMCDTCLCMGAGINIAQGVTRIEPDTSAFAFVGDSTFFASGITGAVNGFYNQANMTLVILDNSTTAMTGHQPHPGTGITMMGEAVEAVGIEQVLRGIGVKTVETVNPLRLSEAIETVRRVSEIKGLKAIIFRYPCIVRCRPKGERAWVNTEKCVGCRRCITELGCPALQWKNGKAMIDSSLCTGCTLCAQVCPAQAIDGGAAQVLNAADFEGAKFGHSGTASMKVQPENVVDENIFGRKNILLCGVGGQGTILASRLIAAAAMQAGLPIRTAETIGMAQRGGNVFSSLRIGKGISSPLIGPGEADCILGFEPAEAVRMLPLLRKGGTVITSMKPILPVSSMTGGKPYNLETIIQTLQDSEACVMLVDTEKALRDLGSDKVLNVLLLGIAARSGSIGLTMEQLRCAVETVLPPKLHALNLTALSADPTNYIRS